MAGFDIDNVQTSIASGRVILTNFTDFVRLEILSILILFLYYAVCTQLSNYVRVAGGPPCFCSRPRETISVK